MSDYLGPITSRLGAVDTSALIDFIDEARHAAEWEYEAAAAERRQHWVLLWNLGVPVRDRRAARAAQRVQADSTLAALHGAVL